MADDLLDIATQMLGEVPKKRKSHELTESQSRLTSADLTDKELSSSNASSANSSAAQSRRTSRDSSEQQIEVEIPPSELAGLSQLARHNHVRAYVADAIEKFKATERDRGRFYFLERTLARSGVDLDQFRWTDWGEECPDQYHMKYELQGGKLYIITAAPLYADVLLRTMVSTPMSSWRPRVGHFPRIGAYGDERRLRLPDLEVKPQIGPGIDGPAAVLFETHAGYMSPRQLRANLRLLFERHPPQTAQYAVIVHMIPDDWSAAAVQWRRDEERPDEFQLVTALDFGVGALSTEAKELFATSEPKATFMPAVPLGAWVRHAVVADNDIRTACNTSPTAVDQFGEWEYEGVWYIDSGSQGVPKLYFPKAVLLQQCPEISSADTQGTYVMDMGSLLERVLHVVD